MGRYKFLKSSPTPILQEHRCDSKSVVLVNVHADMSGYYTCEVTTKRTFETVYAKQYLLVVREYHRQITANSRNCIALLYYVMYVGVEMETDFIC